MATSSLSTMIVASVTALACLGLDKVLTEQLDEVSLLQGQNVVACEVLNYFNRNISQDQECLQLRLIQLPRRRRDHPCWIFTRRIHSPMCGITDRSDWIA